MTELELDTAVQTEQNTYELPDITANTHLERIPAGSNILLSGPPLLGQDRLVYETLARGCRYDQPAIVVSTERRANKVRSRFEDVIDATDLENVYVVDCTGSGKQQFGDDPYVKYVSSPSDLTGIGIGIAKCIRELGDEVESGLRAGLISLTTLLQYADERRVFNFAHVMSQRVAAADYLSLWTINAASHDERTVNTLKSQFEYVAELREGEGGQREMRVLGGPDEWREWRPF